MLSLIASNLPDGLEWSLERVTGTSELPIEWGIHESALALQERTALLPDYGFVDSGNILGTSFSGIVGSLVVLLICVLGCYFFRVLKNKRYG